ncbi:MULTISPECIES: hypothetical protein [Mesorhizobium]|uniref:hypothetical protein n=1 Tax=Mesorhizobium TaxID=68287 RepID=UPI001F32309D|nr:MULTISPECIES: hypothetical protein [Mesorhizobium]MCF6127597.1 hypothetical protein [Mesorhizobium ciceri]MCQ8816231.1 hypothetical protein [Mesorhizobium sp. SEMIA396]
MRPSLHHVEPGIKDQLEVAHQPIKNVYFPERGIASVVATMTGGRQGEVGIVGDDGMKGIAVILKALPGACRLKTFALRLARRFAPQCWIMPTRSSSNHAGRHWSMATPRSKNGWPAGSLMVHDRAEGDKILPTHEFLATMLAPTARGHHGPANA